MIKMLMANSLLYHTKGFKSRQVIAKISARVAFIRAEIKTSYGCNDRTTSYLKEKGNEENAVGT